jgi:aminomethyltransferase
VPTGHGEGITTSGGFAPTLNRSIALARLPARVAPGDPVRVEVRGRELRARVVTPPFVRNGKIQIESIEESA